MAAAKNTTSSQQELQSRNVSEAVNTSQQGAGNAASPAATFNPYLINFGNTSVFAINSNSTDSTSQNQSNRVSVSLTFLQSLLEFKRLSTRMFRDPQLHNTQPFTKYKEHFELSLAKFDDEKKKFVTESPSNIKYDRMWIDPRLTRCNRATCRIERSPGFQRSRPYAKTITRRSNPVNVLADNGNNPNENEWTQMQRNCLQFVRDHCYDSHPRSCKCWKKFKSRLTSNFCSTNQTIGQPNNVQSNLGNVAQQSQPSTSTSSNNVISALPNESPAINSSITIKEEVAEGIYKL